ncbi:DUF2147 domain-containing protein [Methylobacterium nigriterrae]|uniref:DUF2147 domain-containing protein n=1 Tax=Methylobacterium nigriterrae TaxID=3127512 RepID=UPI003013D01C
MTRFIARAATVALITVVAVFSCTHPNAARAAEPFGTWLTEDGRARVRTERFGSDSTRLCGYVVWGSKPLDENGTPKTDRYNPDPSKQGRLQLGHQMLLGLKPNGEGHYEGKVYNADNGKFYDVSVWSDEPATLTVKGCMLVFCASQVWKRVTDIAPGQLQGATNAAGGPRSDPEWTAKAAATGNAPARKGQPTEGTATRPK